MAVLKRSYDGCMKSDKDFPAVYPTIAFKRSYGRCMGFKKFPVRLSWHIVFIACLSVFCMIWIVFVFLYFSLRVFAQNESNLLLLSSNTSLV